MKTRQEIPTPSREIVNSYLLKWSRLQDYVAQEECLKKLFRQTYPENKEIDDILTKVCTLNTFYSTHIFKPYTLAKHIEKIEIDERLESGDLTLVEDISKANGRSFYSFASKYCSHHNPEIYPIYDSYVEQMLLHFLSERGRKGTYRKSLKDYPAFCEAITTFRQKFALMDYTLKEIDRYLWLCGKEYFPKKYKQ